MIDASKYEGHTIDSMTASQASKTHWFLEHPSSPVHSSDILVNKATVDLIQDAPLLLAEVERLREGIKELAESWTDRKVGRPSDLLVLAANELKRLIE